MFKVLTIIAMLICSGCSSHPTKEHSKKETDEFYAFISNGGLLSESEKRMIESSVTSRELNKRNRIKNDTPAFKDRNYLTNLSREIKKEYQKAGYRQVKEMKLIRQNLRKNNSTNWWSGVDVGNISAGGCHSVSSYTRKSGVRVRGYTRCR